MSYTKQEKALGFRLFKCWNGSSLNVKKYKGMHSLSHLSIEMFDLDLEPIFNRKKNSQSDRMWPHFTLCNLVII